MTDYELDGVVWRRSSYSNATGGECVEVGVAWRKSSYSDPNGSNCVEVAEGVPGVVPVRDSKEHGGAVLVVPANAWAAFIGTVTRG